MELTPEQAQAVREAFARGKEAERQYMAGLPVTVGLLTGTKASHAMRLTPDEKRMLDELRLIRDALANASEETRMILAASLAHDNRPRKGPDHGRKPGPDDWLDATEYNIHLLETSVDPKHIGFELRLRGYLTKAEADARDFSAAGLYRPYARYEAVEVLRSIWKAHGPRDASGKISVSPGSHENRSAKSGNYYKFNPFVSFVGANLLSLEPSLETGIKTPRQQGDPVEARTGLEQACYFAWLSLCELRQ